MFLEFRLFEEWEEAEVVLDVSAYLQRQRPVDDCPRGGPKSTHLCLLCAEEVFFLLTNGEDSSLICERREWMRGLAFVSLTPRCPL